MQIALMSIVRPVLCAAALSLSLPSYGQTAFPSKPLHLVTALPAGFDAYVRVFGAKLSDQMGVTVVVDNKVGGNFAIAVQSAASSAPDGYTLLVQSVLMLSVKNLQPGLPFEPINDFAAVARIYDKGASVLLVRNELPVRNVQEFVSLVKTSPGKLSYGSAGSGTLSHLAAEVLLSATNVRAVHVPYKSAAEYLQALLRGDIDFIVGATTTMMPHIRFGKVRVLAVTTSARIKDLPDVPTLSNVFKNDLLNMENWSGLAAPARTPPAIVRRLNAEAVKAIADPGVRNVIEATGNEPAAAESPEQYSAFIRSENDKWREIVKLSGIKPE